MLQGSFSPKPNSTLDWSKTTRALASLASGLALRTLRLDYEASGSDLHCLKGQAQALEVHLPWTVTFRFLYKYSHVSFWTPRTTASIGYMTRLEMLDPLPAMPGRASNHALSLPFSISQPTAHNLRAQQMQSDSRRDGGCATVSQSP